MRRGTVIALGGNSIVPSGSSGSLKEQWSHTDQIAREIVDHWVGERSPLLITHGNGPQVGRILLRSELASREVDPLPLDVAVADSEAGMGYMIQHLLWNRLSKHDADVNTVTLVTRVEVDPDDPAMADPTKPIGLFYTAEEAAALMETRGWAMREDSGRGWRRVVPSPRPLRVIEIEAIRQLVDLGCLVIAGGGGGIPVAKREGGELHGVEGVIDKDHTAALLTEALDFDTLVIVTAIDRVCLRFDSPEREPVSRLSSAEAQAHLDAGEFGVGSMAPKIEAAIRIARSGRRAVITQPGELARALAGEAGTTVTDRED